MIPDLTISGITLSVYWMAILAGAVAMLVLTMRRREQLHISRVKAVVFTLLLTIIGIAGTKVLYILENLEQTLANGLTLGGTSFFGAVFLVPILMLPVGKLVSLSARKTLDLCGLCVTAMIGFARFGCFLSGCCGGNAAVVCGIAFRWPTQAIESICDFLILGLLCRLEQKEEYAGKLYPLFMIFYSVIRFFVEFLRDTPKDWLLLSHGQWFSLLAIAVGGVWLLLKRKGSRA